MGANFNKQVICWLKNVHLIDAKICKLYTNGITYKLINILYMLTGFILLWLNSKQRAKNQELMKLQGH